MKRLRLHALVTFAACSLATAAACAAAETAAPALPGEGEARIYCAQGLERMLPGDYYGCRALYHLQRQHYRQALSMLKEAAYWANKEAQHQLGLAYVNGDVPGISADPPRGIAWLALARERRQPDYERDYAAAMARTTQAQHAQAAAIYLDLRKRYGDAVAGKRATDRFNREIQGIDEASAGGEVMLAGYGPYPMRAYTLSRRLHAQAEKDFAGLQGSVLVGPLQRVSDRVDTATLPQSAAGTPAK